MLCGLNELNLGNLLVPTYDDKVFVMLVPSQTLGRYMIAIAAPVKLPLAN